MRCHTLVSKVSKLLIISVVFVAFSLCFGITSARAEQINSFNSKLQVQNDGTLKVTETIVYDPQGVPHHGILRNIPLLSALNGVIAISNVSVTDEKGVPYHFVQSGSTIINLKIGDPDLTFTTPNTYIISYTIIGTYSYFKDYDEVYWNAVGFGWTFPIANATAEVDLPNGVSSLQNSCYYGPDGSHASCDSGTSISAKGSVLKFVAPRLLNPNEAMTVAVGFPKGVIPPQSTSAKTQDFIFAYLWIVTLLIPPVLTLLLLLRWWLRKGRAPKGTGVIIPQYDVPKGLTPMEVDGALNENVQNKSISAEIIHLAIKGFIKIAQTEQKVFLFTSKDYELQKITELDSTYGTSDQLLINDLFKTSSTIKLSDLKNSFYKNVPVINKAVIGGLVSKGLFRDDPTKYKKRLIIIGSVLLVIAILSAKLFNSYMALFLGVSAGTSFSFGIAIAGIITLMFSSLNSMRTAEGVATKEWILGFKEYLQIAEKDRINFANAPEKKPEVFEKFLPYAIVLGVEKAWAREFEGIYTTPPNWYAGPTGSTFSAIAFTNRLSAFNSAAAVSISSSRSGSGGGGFSGGGGGGGGGGSW